MSFVNEENYFAPFKKHEYVLNCKNESYENKIESLIDVWKSVGELNLSQFDLRHVIQIMDWAKLHALNIVLTADWGSFKEKYEAKLLEEIEKAQNELLKLNSAFATRCKKLADVVKNPWGDPVLMKLMNTKDAEISSEDIEFFCVETAYLVSVRLKKLCESHCEDLALNLVTAFMNCDKLSKTQNFSLNATETQMWFIFDIYIALLYKSQEKQKIVVLLKELTFEQGLQLVKRFAKKRVKISKIWKNCQRIAILAAQLYISQAVVKYTPELKEILESYLEIYISLCNSETLLQDFSTSIRRISNLADASGLYVFCTAIQRKAGVELKPLVIEMYIRALTTDMNELERQKDANELEKVTSTTSRLAEAFCNLASLLDEHVKVARECVLTAFSLEPTKVRLECIETLAKRSGFQVLDTGQDWKCKLHPPTLPSDEITWVCPECGDWMTKPEFNVPIRINMALNEALQNSVLGISESLCDDLVVCLSNPRYQILSWFLPWEDLHRLCIMYLQDPQATKNIVTELKFVDIDYSIFKGIKREPLDEMDGIERGYEQYLDQDFVSDEDTSSNSEDSMSQDSRPYSLGSDGAGEGPYLPMLPAQTKSDPNTLKSLRMFRHNLKRSRGKDSIEATPEKIFKSDSNISSSVGKSEVETKTCASLNQLLKGVSPDIPPPQYPNIKDIIDTSITDFHSKNVKIATLPLLGGQVAKKENTLIQVNHQRLTNSPREKEIPSLMKIPHKQTSQKKILKKDLKAKIPNRSSWNGLKENNSLGSQFQDFRLPTPDLKVYSRKHTIPSSLPVVNILQTHLNQVQPIRDAQTQRLLLSPPQVPKTTQAQHMLVTDQNTSPLKVNILSKQTFNQNQLQNESGNQQMPYCKPRLLKDSPVNQSIPLIHPVFQIPPWAVSIQLRPVHSQQNMEINSENNPHKEGIPSMIPLVEVNKPDKNPPVFQVVKVYQQQSNPTNPVTTQRSQSRQLELPQIMCSIKLQHLPHLVNSREKLLNSFYQSLNPKFTQLLQQQLTPINNVRENHQNKLQNLIHQVNSKKEMLIKKPLGDCSRKEPVLEEQTLQSEQPLNKVEQCRSKLSVAFLKLNNQICQAHNLQAHSLKQPHYSLKIFNSKNQTNLINSQFSCSPQQINSQNPEQIREKSLQPTCFKQPMKSLEQIIQETLTSCSKQNQEQATQKLLHPTFKQTKSIDQIIQETLLSCFKQPISNLNREKIKQKSSQLICSHPQTSNLEQQQLKEQTHQQLNNSVQSSDLEQSSHSANTEKLLLQYNKASHPSKHSLPLCNNLRQEIKSITNEKLAPHNQCSSRTQQQSNNQLPQPLQVQSKNQDMEVKQILPLTNRSISHNNYCSLLRVPNHCLNSDGWQTSQPNLGSPQIIKHCLEEQILSPPLRVSREQKNPTFQRSQDTELKTSPDLGKMSSRETVLVSLGNQQDKLESSLEQSNNLHKLEIREDCQMQKNFYSSLNITNKSDGGEKTASERKLHDIDLLCNNSNFKTNGNATVETRKNDDINRNDENVESSKKMAQCEDSQYKLFSDCSEYDSEDDDFRSKNKNECTENRNTDNELPKNMNLTGNIRTYARQSKKKLLEEYKDCVKTLTGVNVLDVCKNVNIINSTENLHSNVQNFPTKPKELKIVLCPLPSNKRTEGKCTSNKEENSSIKLKCDRGKTPPKYSRWRKSVDESENKVGKAPNQVQNHNLSPLQDVNLRVNSQLNSKVCCDLKPNALDESKSDCLCSQKNLDNKPSDAADKKGQVTKKHLPKSILSNVPGLSDFQLIKPVSEPQVVNVVQVSGGRQPQNVSIQNSQTSTQITPHIQRIGQPRIAEQKPEHSNAVTSTTQTTSTTSATSRTTSTQPSTLINILSQQIRPVGNPTQGVRRQGPLINILSHQIFRPAVTTKTAVHSTTNSTSTSTEASQVKVAVSAEQTVLNSTLKTTNAVVKNTNTVSAGQGGTILQFICKSSLPKFQQAFGKTVYQNSTEAADSSTTAIEVANNVVSDVKKTVTTKTVPVSLQPIPGSVIYSRQLPAGQAISLLPPGTTATRQVFRIATSNAEQLGLVKDSVIHSKMSALLAAALQGRPKNADGEIILNTEELKGTVVRPALVQGARIVKPVQLQMATNVVRTNTQQPNLSSTTLEQLREFDMVYKQIKERSTTSISESCTNAEGQEGVAQRISVTYVNQLQKYTQLSPVVVVTSYSNLQPAASPALSVTSQGSSSPCVTPASTPTLPKIATKNSKGKTIKTTASTTNSPTKSSPIPKPQQKPQEDEHTTQRIFDILAEYAEQLRNSPDLNNKPAPRRRSNPPTNPSQNSKRKKSASGVKKSGQSSSTLDMDTDDMTIGSEDSSGGGVVQLSVTDDEQSQASTSVNTTESSNENPSPPSTRSVILAEGAQCTNQSRNLIIADSSVGEALKIPNTAVIVPGSYIMPVSMVKGGQQIAVVSSGSKILATVPARSGQNMLLLQSFTNQSRKSISAVKYSTIQPITGITTQTLAGVTQQPVLLPSTVALGQPLTLKRIGDERVNSELLLAISQPKEEPKESNDVQPDSSTSISSDSVDIKLEDSDIKIEDQSDNSNEKVFHTYQKTVVNSVETSVIAKTTPTSKGATDVTTQTVVTPTTNAGKVEPKRNERIQSVLVTTCSTNGPMLSHINPRYRKASDKTHTTEETNKGDFHHNGEKPHSEPKNFRGNSTYYVNKTKKVATELQKVDSELQKQAAIERELRLQKSLSEECEDLGVDEPSTSDLFPEADLLFDSNHSPSYDQTSQEVLKRTSQVVEIKEEVKESMNLFSDDEHSSSLRADLFEYVEYQPVEAALDYQGRPVNGNNIETGSSGCEDNTLLPKCTAMSEVTLNSPISPEMHQEATIHKYKFKYTNRKKGEKIKQNEYSGEVVSSSGDIVVCTEITKANFEENYKIVHLAKSEIAKEGKCELHCEDDVDSPSGRGARRSVRKLCSCCNGTRDGNLPKKRPHTSRPHVPATPQKKAFLNKKR